MPGRVLASHFQRVGNYVQRDNLRRGTLDRQRDCHAAAARPKIQRAEAAF